ncbi:peptidoglycan editing factor PgeF [Nitrosomonas sp. ANs5]|uniref:peptidoglycan editing factor PgeF n=1 Tax=Nitrosomonas sp. ANs5 TaxID=3423941 RepID=UPI003D3318B2
MIDWIVPDWPSPGNVKAVVTTRQGGVSQNIAGAYASFNLATHVNDNPDAVLQNRARLRRYLPAEPRWLTQVHGSRPIWVNTSNEWEGDAAISRDRGVVCAILVADCLPVLLCDTAGSVVAVVHAGWRGLAGGIIENTIREMHKYAPGEQIIAWLGPAIGPGHFEVGEEVRAAFVAYNRQAAGAFVPAKEKGKWYANLFDLARQRLAGTGVGQVYGGDVCTFSDAMRFYSYRRDGVTGRMAGLVWLA